LRSNTGKAVKRLEEIIVKIESEEIDVDELSDKVKEAVERSRSARTKSKRPDGK